MTFPPARFLKALLAATLCALTFAAGLTVPDGAPHGVVVVTAEAGREPARIFMPAMKPSLLLTPGQGLPGDHRRLAEPDIPGGQHVLATAAEGAVAPSGGPRHQVYEASFGSHAVAVGTREPRAPPSMS
ncbi:hypothetical protein [Streptosporangium sp. KLBMP 9127]|nr:hypothetical protein [Streptosporangium sp. KLBMP 9127]